MLFNTIVLGLLIFIFIVRVVLVICAFNFSSPSFFLFGLKSSVPNWSAHKSSDTNLFAGVISDPNLSADESSDPNLSADESSDSNLFADKSSDPNLSADKSSDPNCSTSGSFVPEEKDRCQKAFGSMRNLLNHRT